MHFFSRKFILFWFCCIVFSPGAAQAQNYSDSWWNPDESGWGLTITDHDADLFVQWYTYDRSGHNQKYVISGGTLNNGRCQFGGTLQHVSGPSWSLPVFDPALVTRTDAGYATIDFCPTDSAPGTIVFNYSVDGVIGSKPLTRMQFGSDAPRWNGIADTGGADFTDLWWNPDESGWGVSITQHGNNVYARIFVYDDQGLPLLLSVPGVTFLNPHNFSGIVQMTGGPWFGTTPFDPSQVVRTTAGSASFSFSDANHGRLTYNVNGAVVSKAITRLEFAAPSDVARTCYQSSGTVTPAISSQAAWDAAYDRAYGTTVPDLWGGAKSYASQGHYWVRAFVSMAKTYGDTKYLDRAVKTIDHWFANRDSVQGWGAALGSAQMMLDTGIIAQAIAIFSYEVWNDFRFTAYRTKADAYISLLEPILHSYDDQWIDGAPYPGSPGFYIYDTCGGLCSKASLVMYNQGATMATALLLIDRVYRLRGQTPDPGYRHKADAAAAYFKTFVRQNGDAYLWDYGGARPNTGVEDTSHAHLDLSLMVWAKYFGLGGLTDTDMRSLAATMNAVLRESDGQFDVALKIDGTGLPSSNWDRVSIGYDWIELSDYDPSLFDKIVSVFNKYMSSPAASRFYLGWAEILRKRGCVWL